MMVDGVKMAGVGGEFCIFSDLESSTFVYVVILVLHEKECWYSIFTNVSLSNKLICWSLLLCLLQSFKNKTTDMAVKN